HTSHELHTHDNIFDVLSSPIEQPISSSNPIDDIFGNNLLSNQTTNSNGR
ncbi:unnamed protein product, partial [Rotaria magnacalcarata]